MKRDQTQSVADGIESLFVEEPHYDDSLRPATIQSGARVSALVEDRRDIGITTSPEYFVGAEEAAKFLQLSPRRVKDLARGGTIPAHPIGDGARKVWRFLLSELYEYMMNRRISNA